MAIQSHRSDPRILGRRTLQRDHRVLAGMLRPGMSVLDIGCGTGAITAGIARAVGPSGRVLGVDRDAGLLQIAADEHGDIPNLEFAHGEVADLHFQSEFDIVTAARTLQWIAAPERAIARLSQAVRLAGTIVVLDYNHTKNAWDPAPPEAFRDFYSAFLTWRNANQWDNDMADHLPELFASEGLIDIRSQISDETTEPSDPDFAARSALWFEVMEGLGEQIARMGFCSESRLREASATYLPWTRAQMRRQTLSMRTVVGKSP